MSDQRVSLRRSSSGEVEESRQHQGGELDRHGVDPVEGLALGKGVEQVRRAFADHRLDVAQVARGGHVPHRLALVGVGGRIHRDERRQRLRRHLLGGGDLLDPQVDALRRGIGLPVAVDGANSVVLGDRPVATGRLDLVEVHRVFGAETGEVILPAIFLEQMRVRRVDLGEVEIGRRRHAFTALGHLHLGRADVRVEEGALSSRIGRVSGLGHRGTPRPGSGRLHSRQLRRANRRTSWSRVVLQSARLQPTFHR